MKPRWNQNSTIIPATMLFALSSSAEVQLHDLRDPNGRTVTAQIMSYDSIDDAVEIKRADEKIYTVNLGIFGEDTQEYIRNWGYEYEFYHALSISAEITKSDVPETDFGADYEEVAIENIGYIITLQNPTATTFD